MLQWLEWASIGAQHPLGEFYRHTNANYPPGYVTILWLLGRARLAVPLLAAPEFRYLWMKAPALLGDLAVAALIWRLVARQGLPAATLWAAAYVFNPAVVSDSAIWGQTDGLVPLCPLLGLALLQRGAGAWVGVPLGLAMTVKFQSIAVVLPLFAYVLAAGGARQLFAVVAMAALSFLTVTLPFALTPGQFARMLQAAYVGNIDMQPLATIGAYNVWRVAMPFAPSDDHALVHVAGLALTPKRLGLALFGAAWGAATLAGCSTTRTAGRAYALGIAAWAFFTFPTQMHERYLLPAVAFFTVAAPTSPVAALAWGGVSFLHLYGSFLQRALVDPLITWLAVPAFFVGFFQLRALGATTAPAGNGTRQRWLGAAGHWVTAHIGPVTLVLVLATGASALGASGRLHGLVDELRLTRLGPYRSPAVRIDRGADRGPLVVGGAAFPRGIQLDPGQVAGFRIPPGFGALRAGIGIDAPATAPEAACRAVFIVRGHQERFRSAPLAPGAPVQWIDVPLSIQDTDLTLSVEPSDCAAPTHFDWIDPRLVSRAQLVRETDAPVIYVSDLPDISVWRAWWRNTGYSEWRRDRSVFGNPIAIAGQHYTRGLGVHADSVLEFDVPPGVNRFVTDIGYNDEVGPPIAGREVQFIIRVDGREAYRSPLLHPQERVTDVQVSLRGARHITLVVDSAGSSDGDHADWGDARFVRDHPPSGPTKTD